MQQTTPHKPITSRDNSVVKYIGSLAEHKYRKKEKAFVIEGVKMVQEAIRDDLGVKMVVAAPPLVQHHGKGVLKLAENKSIAVLWVSEKIMSSLSESKTPQPVMAVVGMRQYSEDQLLAGRSRLVVVADRLQDPGNLGSIIRTAEAVGASGLALTPNTADPFNAKAIRGSMGSILRLPVVPVPDLTEFLKTSKRQGYQTIATFVTGEKTHFGADMTKPSVLIFGQEGGGLPPELISDIDLPVRIPMAPGIDSLNVAAAAAVVLYEALRQRTRHIGDG